MHQNLLCSWSGGKDSCFALMQAIMLGKIPKVLLNVLNEEGKISRSHGIPANILHAQAQAIDLPLHAIASSWEEYEKKFTEALRILKQEYQLTYAVFGDIDLDAHREWEEKVCAAAELHALLPLWKQDRRKLVMEMLESGIETMIVSCNETMGPGFLGKKMDEALVNELESIGVDVCGENGEFHTLVLDCPLFNNAIQVQVIEKLHHGNYWFTRLELEGKS